MVAHHANFDPSERMLRSRFEIIQPQIRQRIESSYSSKGVFPDACVESAVEQAYHLFVHLAKQGSLELAYPTPLALAALRLQQQKRRSGD